ncbi:MAG: hypothetical protein LBI59_09535 [Candidatus Accumulibacter sp.]|jgi:hypothetical protein|nr:hypothetical protein [Accumulibacter sp.]
MPLPAPVIASIVSAIIETVAQSPQPADASTSRYSDYVVKRALPPEAKVGFMQPISGDGTIVIDDKKFRLSPVARFRSQKNLIVMPMTVQQASNVVYLNDNFGSVHRVWMISQAEADSLKND